MDGCHLYECVDSDLQIWLPKLSGAGYQILKRLLACCQAAVFQEHSLLDMTFHRSGQDDTGSSCCVYRL